MEKFNSVEEALDFAIVNEEEAYQFYTELADNMKLESMKNVFLGFAKEELGHKEKFMKIKAGEVASPPEKKVTDLKISDFVVDVQPSDDMDYQDALILAMKKEKAAFKLYTKMAEISEDAVLKKIFFSLAQEEAKHKLRFEIEYDDYVFNEN